MNVVDLFCGAGGLSHGMQQAGFNIVGGLDSKEWLKETFEKNHQKSTFLATDIRKVDGENLEEVFGKIDILMGCPPCQGFSSYTNNDDDKRNLLLDDFGRILHTLQDKPEYVMLENVQGLANQGEHILGRFLTLLKHLGYSNIAKDVVDMSKYGIPQKRRRFVLLASRNQEVNLPKPNNKSTTLQKIFENPLPKAKYVDEVDNPKNVNWHITTRPSKIVKQRIQCLNEGDDRTKIPNKLRPKCHKNKNTGYLNVYARMTREKPSPTVTTRFTTISSGRWVHPTEDRPITVREAARIQTFPDNFQFHSDSYNKVKKMIGNAFPPAFARQIGIKLN